MAKKNAGKGKVVQLRKQEVYEVLLSGDNGKWVCVLDVLVKVREQSRHCLFVVKSFATPQNAEAYVEGQQSRPKEWVDKDTGAQYILSSARVVCEDTLVCIDEPIYQVMMEEAFA